MRTSFHVSALGTNDELGPNLAMRSASASPSASPGQTGCPTWVQPARIQHVRVVDGLASRGRVHLSTAVLTFRGGDCADADFLSFAGSVALVAIEGTSVVGWCWGYFLPRPDGGAMGYLHELEVLETYRRLGVGRELVTSFARALASRGATRMFLTTGQANTGARALYEELGANVAAQGPTVNYWFGLPRR